MDSPEKSIITYRPVSGGSGFLAGCFCVRPTHSTTVAVTAPVQSPCANFVTLSASDSCRVMP